MNALKTIKTGSKMVCTFAKVHKKPILIVVGVGCITGSIATAVIQAPKAKEAILMAKEMKAKEAVAKGIGEDDPESKLSFGETVKTGARYLWLPVALGASGTIILLVVNHISVSEATAAGADALAYKQAYNDLAKLHNEYVRGVNKVTTEEQQKEIMKETAIKAGEKPCTDVNVIAQYKNGNGKDLYLDTGSGQFIESTDTFICNAAMEFNDARIENGLCNPYCYSNGAGTLNEWYVDYLHANAINLIGNELYFTNKTGFGIYISEEYWVTDDGRPYKKIYYKSTPVAIIDRNSYIEERELA